MAQTVQDTLSVTENTGSSSVNVSAIATESSVLLASGGNSLRVGVDTASGASIGTVNAFSFALRTVENRAFSLREMGMWALAPRRRQRPSWKLPVL